MTNVETDETKTMTIDEFKEWFNDDCTFHRHNSMIIHKQTLDMETTWLLSPRYHPDWNDTLTKNTVRTNGLSSSLTMIGLGFRSEIYFIDYNVTRWF